MPAMTKSATVQRSTATVGTRHNKMPADGSSSERYSAKNQTTTPHTSRRMGCFLRSTLLCIGIVGLFILRYPSFIEHNIHSRGEIIAKIDHVITGPLNPEVEKLQGIDHFYMLPPANATADGKPKGILLYIHSCKQSGKEFFILPEHRIVAYDAMLRGLVIFSPTSYDRKSGCYTSADADGFLEEVVREFVNKHHFRRLPRVGLGYSSGGAFLPFVSKALKLESMAVYHSPQEDIDIDIDIDNDEDVFIPTVYIGMSSDTSISNQMKAKTTRLEEMNIPSYLYKVPPRPFTKSLCKARLPEIKGTFCDHIFETIQVQYSNLIDYDGFVIVGDLKLEQWQSCFRQLERDYESRYPTATPELEMKNLPQYAAKSWLRVILELEIQSCYGFHGMTAQFHSETLEFLISNSRMKQSAPLNH